MEQESVQNEIVVIVEELISKMGFSSAVEVKKAEEDVDAVICNIKTEESSFLIGQYGLNLQALQHITRVIIRKRILQPVNFILDVNSYRQEKNDSVVRLARSLAQEVVSEGREVVMRPMTAYERRIVHMELSKNNQIKTESIGEGESRRIVIKPAETA
jgi:spoIIIJ-associated protein